MFFRYLISGTINTLIAFLTYASLVTFTPLPFWAANFAGVVLSMISGLLLGKYFVFTTSGATIAKVWWKYFAGYVVQYGLGTSLIGLMIHFGTGEIIAWIVHLPPMVVFGYCIQKFWIFRPATMATGD